MKRRWPFAALLGFAVLVSAPLAGQTDYRGSEQDRAAVVGVTEEALRLITEEDFVGLTDLMIEGANIVSIVEADGQARLRSRTREEEREVEAQVDIVERGFDPTVMISGPMAVVWLPYDLYVDGRWSHCGVDTFTLMRIDGAWKIAGLAYTVEQPPACREHPDGPPGG